MLHYSVARVVLVLSDLIVRVGAVETTVTATGMFGCFSCCTYTLAVS